MPRMVFTLQGLLVTLNLGATLARRQFQNDFRRGSWHSSLLLLRETLRECSLQLLEGLSSPYPPDRGDWQCFCNIRIPGGL